MGVHSNFIFRFTTPDHKAGNKILRRLKYFKQIVVSLIFFSWFIWFFIFLSFFPNNTHSIQNKKSDLFPKKMFIFLNREFL